MALVVGLDIDARSFKCAVLSGNSRKYRLVDFFVEPLPSMHDTSVDLRRGEDGEDEADEFDAPLGHDEIILRALESRGLDKAEIVASIESKDCGIREITVPFTKDEQIDRTVVFEAEHHFHAFDLDEVVLEWAKAEEMEDKSRLVLFAARHELIDDRLGTLKRAGIDPVSLDLDAAALANSFSISPYYDETKSSLLIDMGVAETKIILVEEGRLAKVRSLRTAAAVLDPSRMIAQPAAVGAEGGADDEDGLFAGYSIEARFQEIENALKNLEPSGGIDFGQEADGPSPDAPIAIVSDEEFERISSGGTEAERAVSELPTVSEQSPVGMGGSADPESDYDAYLQRIGVEIERTFATARLAAPIELICLTGELGRREDARLFFQDRFDTDTVELDFGDSLESDVPLDDVCTEGSVAVGLAAKGLGVDLVGLDFRKGRFRFEHKFEKLRFPLLNCAVLCLLVFLQTTWWSFQKWQTYRGVTNSYRAESERVYKTFFGKELVKGRSPAAAASAEIKKWKQGGLGDVGRFLPYTDVVKNVSDVLSTTGLWYRIDSMKYVLKLAPTGAKKANAPAWRAQESKLTLFTEESTANLAIEKAFGSSTSKYFDASTNASPDKDGYKIQLTLRVKSQLLK